MANKHLKAESHQVIGRLDAWWYEEHRGISVVVEQDAGETKIINIPWKTLRSALRRKDQGPHTQQGEKDGET